MTAWSGHAAQEGSFLGAVASGRLPHAWLLAGPRGLGKAGFALRAATFLIADGIANAAGTATLDPPPGHPALGPINAGAHSELLRLTRVAPKSRTKGDNPPREDELARNITVDQVRELLTRLRVRPAGSAYRAVIIDSIDDLERGAANALLKTLEEPPHNTVFLLVSHRPGSLLPTIRSRCRLLWFAPLDDVIMRGVLTDRLPDAAPEAIDALVRIGAGAPGRALAYAALDLAGIDAQLRAIVATGDADNRMRSDLARTLSLVAQKPRFAAMLDAAAALAAGQARASSGAALGRALQTRDRILDLSRHAVSGSEDAATVTFAVGSALASMAPGSGAQR